MGVRTGSPMKGTAGRRPTITPAQIEQIRKLRVENKWGEKKIAKAVGVNRSSVRLHLIKMGLQKSSFNPETTKNVLALIGAGMTHEQIASELHLSQGTVGQVKYMAERVEAVTPLSQRHPKLIDERKKIARTWKPGRYVVGNDSHIRFHSKKCLDAILSLKGDYDGFIMAGDLIDAYWISSFRKSDNVSFASEIASATEVMRLLCEKFGRVLYFHGNHEERLWKQLLETTTPVRGLAGGAKNKKGEDVVSTAIQEIQDWYFGRWPNVTVHYNWFVEIGQVLVSHADLYSQMQGRTAANILEHFMNHMDDWKIEHDIHGILEAHLHRMDGPKRRWGRWLWELPCMCGPLDYQLGARASRGQVDTGFSVMTVNKNGTMNFNESRSFLLDDTTRSDRKIVIVNK